MNFGDKFIYGTQYWRPVNPPRDQHRFHLTKIKNELKFDLVKLRMLWNWHHREADKFVWDEVHEIFDICDELDLGVQLELNLESAPYWMEQEYPETRYVNANGRAIELGSQEATPGGGHPGLCFHNEIVRQQSERFVRAMVREFKDRDSLLLYDCWNEPHLEPAWCANMWGNMGDKVYCYCDGSRAEFRVWLQKKYGDIETFNAAWGRAYTTFEHINPPILQGNYADWMDWLRFWHDELKSYIAWRYDLIKQEDPARAVASHSGAVPPVLPRANAVINNWNFADEVDLWGTSFAPQAFNWDLATCAQVIEVTRSASRGKPFWVAEMPGGPGCIRGFRSGRIPTPENYELWNWMAAAFGSLGTVHWCYLTERTGHEAGNFGMVRLNGKDTPRSKSIAKTAGKLHEYQDVLASAKVQTQVAVLFDPDVSSLLFAMELEDLLYGQSHIGYYRAIWEADLCARYVTPDCFDDIDEKILVIPMALTMTEELADKIAKFVHDGGTLIAECRSGMFDEHGFLRAEIPAGKLSEAAGLVEGEQICSDQDKDPNIIMNADGQVLRSKVELPQLDPIQLGPPISFSQPAEVDVPAQEFLTPLELDTATPIGKYGDTVFAAHNRYGKGQVYYFGTYIGLALVKKIPQADELVGKILRGSAVPVVSGQQLRPRLIRGEKRSILVVFNENNETVSETITLPVDFDDIKTAKDIYTQDPYTVIKGKLPVTLESGKIKILALQ